MKKFFPLYNSANFGLKIKQLRIKNKMTLKELSTNVQISVTTIMHIEQNKISTPYQYWKKICDFYNVNYVQYLELYTLPENTLEEKLWKMRIYIGAKNWDIVAKKLNYTGATISDILINRYVPSKNFLYNLENFIKEIKGD